MLQLHVLKLIKSQVPFCGRKWRQCGPRLLSSVISKLTPFFSEYEGHHFYLSEL